MRVLSDIVKRRSFRANGTVACLQRLVAKAVLRAPTERRRSDELRLRSSRRRLDRYRRRFDLEVKLVFLISDPAKRIGAGMQVLANCRLDHRRDGWALIMRAIKCRKGIWWMPWR